ncbi:MAG: DUF6444 domain-containing protein [Jatrophihabitantaceae bacterium]
MAVPEELSRDQLITLAHRQAAEQISAMAAQVSDLVEANEELGAKLARLEHLMSRNSGNSSCPPSQGGGPGKTPPKQKKRRDPTTRTRGKQPGAPGTNLAWVDEPDERRARYPQGCCDCG